MKLRRRIVLASLALMSAICNAGRVQPASVNVLLLDDCSGLPLVICEQTSGFAGGSLI